MQVKDQEACGSCWAFSATETIESNVAIAAGTLLTLAPQELVDCVPNPDECGGTGGCEGATQPIAFNWTVNHPMPLETSYPYKGRDGESTAEPLPSPTLSAAVVVSAHSVPDAEVAVACAGTCQLAKQGAAGIKGYEHLPANDYTSLMTAVATVGPVAISVDASWMMCAPRERACHLVTPASLPVVWTKPDPKPNPRELAGGAATWTLNAVDRASQVRVWSVRRRFLRHDH